MTGPPEKTARRQDAKHEDMRKRLGEHIKANRDKVKELRVGIARSKDEAKAFEAALKEAKSWSDLKVTK